MKKLVLKKLSFLYSFISHPYGFITVLAFLLIWGVVGYFMHYDEKWYKIIHLVEIVVTLLMVFIIEFTQRADMEAMHKKLDELITKLPQTDSKKAGIEKTLKGEEK